MVAHARLQFQQRLPLRRIGLGLQHALHESDQHQRKCILPRCIRFNTAGRS
jgi:hypothetical protein